MSSVKFNFNDNSFLSIEEQKDQILFIMCGKKNFNSTVMSSSTLNKEQIEELVIFLQNYLKNKISSV